MRHLQLKVPFETKFRNLLSATTFSLHKDSRFHIPFLLLGITGAGSFICWCFPGVTILSAIYMYVYHKCMQWYCKCNSKLLFKVLFKRNLHFLEPKGICKINILLTLVCRSVMKVLELFFFLLYSQRASALYCMVTKKLFRGHTWELKDYLKRSPWLFKINCLKLNNRMFVHMYRICQHIIVFFSYRSSYSLQFR